MLQELLHKYDLIQTTDGDDNDRAIFGLATANGHFFSTAVAGDTAIRTTNGGNLCFGEGTTERVRIDSAGRLLIGRTTQLASSAERLTIDSGMAMFRRNSTNAAAVYIRNEDSTADTRQPYLIFADGSGNRGGFGVQNDELLYGFLVRMVLHLEPVDLLLVRRKDFV